jgi:uncharacterized membrane protein (UPF0182 family)
LQQVIAVYGNLPAAIEPTLSAALTQVFQAPVSTTTSTGGTGTLSPQVRALLAQAQQAYQQSQTDLKAGNLGAYQTDINNLESELEEVQELTGATASTTSPPTTTPTTATTTSTATTSRSR